MKKLLIASSNAKKILEFKAVLKDIELELFSLKDFNDHDDVIEDGKNFYENAYLKAEYFANKYKMLTISDDSGLEVDALNNRPGVNSKRYSNNGDLANNEKLLFEMKDIKNRKASFTTVLCLYRPNLEPLYFSGVIEGEIAHKIRGEDGFGYDPIFLIPKYHKTFAELGIDLKNKISHRALALHKFKEYLNENLTNE